MTSSDLQPVAPLRILLVGDYPDDARLGSTKVMYKLKAEYEALGHRCDLLLAGDIARRPAQAHARQLVGPTLAARAIARAEARRGPYDVVDAAGADGAVFGLLHQCAARHARAVFISRSNGLEHLNYRRMLDDHRAGILHKPWTRRLWFPAVRLTQVTAAARTADELVVLNERDRAFALERRWLPPARTHVIAHGVSARFVRGAPHGATARGAGILFCGSWTGTKGIDYLVPAFTQLVRSGAPARLTVLGGGVPDDIITGSFPQDVRSSVRVIARAPEEEVIEHYRRHDLLVFPSTYEGFGMVVLEAMTQGLPVIATAVGCAASLVVHDTTGLIVPPRDVGALERAMGELLADAPRRARIADAATTIARPFTWAATARHTLAVYAAALARRNRYARRH